MAASFGSPCAACKYLRRKCTQECVFAPYFPPDNPRKFANVHRVFGASNVSKLLNELSATDRDDAVRSLAYEADYRLKDPVYGCVGHISILQQRLHDMRSMLLSAKKELATYIGPQAMLPILQPPDFFVQQQPSGMIPQHQGPSGMIPQRQGPSVMIPQHQGPSGMIPQHQSPSRMIPQHQGPSGMIPQQQGPSGMVSQQQCPSGMVPQQQAGPSGTIRQEHPLIMLPEEQHMGSPSTTSFAYNNMAGPAIGAQARTSHGSQLMIREVQQSQQHKQESRQPIFESQQLADAIAEREQEMMGYEQQKRMQLEFWRVNSKFNTGSGSGDVYNDMSNVAGAGTVTDVDVSPSLALGTYDDNPYHFQPQQPEQQPPSDPHLQYLAQEPEQHHSHEPCHEFQPQQPEQHPSPDSYRQFLPQQPEQHHSPDSYRQFLPQQPEQHHSPDPYRQFLPQQPEQHHSPDPYRQFLPQQPERHHSPDPYRQFLPQQPEQHHFPDSYHQFLPQQPEQHHHPNPYRQFLPQHQHRPNPHELQTQLFFRHQQPQPLQQIPQLQQPQQQQLRPGEDKDSNVCPT